MKCDICGKHSRSYYVYPKGDGAFGIRCPNCDYEAREEKPCLKIK